MGEAILWLQDTTVAGGSVVCVETRLWAGPSEVRIPLGVGDLSLPHNVQTGKVPGSLPGG
jgi:hypothetical protein